MFKNYYQDELGRLREAAVEFSKNHPALAPMLDGMSSDPDVERVLEGVAYLTGLVRQKIDDEFPEIIHEMIRHLWPHYLRCFPASTMIRFEPMAVVQQTSPVSAGTYLASVPVNNVTACRFKTIYDVDIHPLAIKNITFDELAGRSPSLKLDLHLNKLNLSSFDSDTLRFHLGGDYNDASYLYLLLREHLKNIRIKSTDSDSEIFLLPNQLKQVGFSHDEGLIPYPANIFPGYRLIQEYFLMPEKFLFLDLTGLEKWKNRGSGHRFEIIFDFDSLPEGVPNLQENSIMLYVTPAVNLFPHDADPIDADHKRSDYLVRPTTDYPDHYQVYSLDRVTGLSEGSSKERKYSPFHSFEATPEDGPVYNEAIKISNSGDRMDHYISVSYGDEIPEFESLSLELTCTNGFLTENLQAGDINVPTESTPSFVTFSNIRRPTVNVLPSLEKNYLWKLVSMFSLNYTSLMDVENLKLLLNLYVFEESRDRVRVTANKNRIEGIKGIEEIPVDRFVMGIMMRGRKIKLKVRSDHFAGLGDMYLFGTMLENFFALYASMNTFTKLVIEDVLTGESYAWPERT